MGPMAATGMAVAQIDRVVEALEASGHADNAIVVVRSDHIYHFGLNHGNEHACERSTRVPLIFAGPAVRKGGKGGGPAAGRLFRAPISRA